MSQKVKQSWPTKALTDTYYTKDVPDLEKFEWHYLFVYGTLKKNFDNNDYLQDEELISQKAYTAVNGYKMETVVNDKYHMPFITFESNVQKRGHIRGEVYRVSPNTIYDIDTLECNGFFYNRVRLPIIISSHHKQSILCWAYIGNSKYLHNMFNNPHVWQFKDVPTIGSESTKFYLFK